MIYIIDYGAGNLKSIYYALVKIYPHITIVEEANQIKKDAQAVVLPGDGCFVYTMQQIQKRGFAAFILDNHQSIPILGICVGFQVFFQSSTENGGAEGLGLIKGQVKKFSNNTDKDFSENFKIPHMGWNNIILKKQSNLTKNIKEDEYFYFIHSYYASCLEEENILMNCHYIENFCCGIEKNNLVGFQFHLEKSGQKGISLLKNFIEGKVIKN